MLIISKTKDYYDYLTGIYGIDKKVILDRRNYRNFNFILNKTDLSFYYKSLKYKEQVLFVIEIGTAQYLFCGTLNHNEFVKKFNLGTQLINRLTGDYKTHDHEKWDVCATNQYLMYGDILRFKKIENISINDLIHYGFGYANGIFLRPYAKFIPAQEAYDNIYNFLIAEKDEAKECKMTDIQKLLSKGFDKKTSFRNM